MEELKFRNIKAEEIELRVGSVTKKGYTLLLYKNARVDMAILDEVVGQMNWQRDHKEVKGNLYCGIGIWNGEQWIWKWDCGAESFSDKEKGEASDSFKRAGFNWGIGRELYTAPFIWINCDCPDKKIPDDELKRINRLRVSEINIKDKTIIGLEITDTKNVVYSFGELPKQEGESGAKAQKRPNVGFTHTGFSLIGTPADDNNCLFALQEILSSDYPDTAEQIKNHKIDLQKVADAFEVRLWELSIEDIKTAVELKVKANEKAN